MSFYRIVPGLGACPGYCVGFTMINGRTYFYRGGWGILTRGVTLGYSSEPPAGGKVTQEMWCGAAKAEFCGFQGLDGAAQGFAIGYGWGVVRGKVTTQPWPI